MRTRGATEGALVGLALVLAVAGCGAAKGVLNRDAAQLERFKALRAERGYAAIADEAVDCDAGASPVCRQLHLIRGDACLVLAERGEAPVAERYGCAVAGLRAGIDGGPGEPAGIGALQPFEERLLAALRGRQDLARSRAEAAPFAAELAARAEGFTAAYPHHPAGYFYGGGARLAEVLADVAAGRGDAAAACDTLARIAALADGVPDAGAYAPNLARLRDDALGARRALPGCAP